VTDRAKYVCGQHVVYLLLQGNACKAPPAPQLDAVAIGVAHEHLRYTAHQQSGAGALGGVMGHWSLVIGHQSLVIGHRSLVIGHRSLVIAHRSLVIGHRSSV
jgi:hypothetical protein